MASPPSSSSWRLVGSLMLVLLVGRRARELDCLERARERSVDVAQEPFRVALGAAFCPFHAGIGEIEAVIGKQDHLASESGAAGDRGEALLHRIEDAVG